MGERMETNIEHSCSRKPGESWVNTIRRCSILDKVAIVASGIIFIAFTVAYIYFFDFEEIQTIGISQLPISLLSYLGGTIALATPILSAMKIGKFELLDDFRFEIRGLALCLFALSIVLLQN